MSALLEKFKDINNRLETVKALIEVGNLRIKEGSIIHNGFKVKPVFDNNCSIVIATAEKVGDLFPSHCHKGIVQYLICIKGKFIVDFIDTFGSRILHAKECVSIPPNMKHKITALEAESELIGLCIPEDEAYKVKGNSGDVW